MKLPTKEQAGFDLTVGPHGARLKPSPPISSLGDADASAAHRAPTVTDSEGFPILPHGFDGPLTVHKNEGSVVHLYTRANQSMDQLEEFLRRTLKAPVRNSTGLAGKYEIRLSYEVNTSDLLLNGEPMAAPCAGGATDPQATASTLAASLDRRLGLKLVPAKVGVDTIVVEHVEKKPAGN